MGNDETFAKQQSHPSACAALGWGFFQTDVVAERALNELEGMKISV